MKRNIGFIIAATFFYVSGIGFFLSSDKGSMSVLGYGMFVLGIVNTRLFFYYKNKS